ncbi:FAD-dependent monooxygenase [Nonomuraea sp. H19]|uniref:FAD-dependent monooxygenase n=1 Tax=Nonomuraea sp. H19 TaxID=3452206 RepID=UPI003F8A88C2
MWPPAAALGANSAVQDAHNLAWKIAAMLAGRTSDALLDTYEAERRPVALELADLTVRSQAARIGPIPRTTRWTRSCAPWASGSGPRRWPGPIGPRPAPHPPLTRFRRARNACLGLTLTRRQCVSWR